jgi:hypothetical protein
MLGFGHRFASRLIVMTILLSMAAGSIAPQAAASSYRSAGFAIAVETAGGTPQAALQECASAFAEVIVSQPGPWKCNMGSCRMHFCVGDFLPSARAELEAAMRNRLTASRPVNRWIGIEPGYIPPPPKPDFS